MNLAQILEYVVYYAPVALFLLFVFWGLIVGLIRGFRKSLILFIQALAAAGICVGIFYFLVNNASTDKWVYDISSKWVDYNKLLETTTEYTCIKDVLVDAILKNQDYGTTFALILEENGAYLDTLVNLAYRIVLFVVLLVVFFVLVFLFYLVYFFFYPERRKKAKCRARERLGNGNGYHKHTFFGGLVGAFRGAIVGLVWLSFIGALFFIVAGGEGDNRPEDYPDYTFTDDSLNEAYSTYKVVGSYGSRGIFRILNTVKDQENVPFYLFAANMVLSGNLNVEESNIHTTVRFTKEIANYTSFANSTIKLILKYDKDKEIISAINSKDSNKLLDLMNKLMEDENFQAEYDQLIDSFNAGTYFINFGLSFVNSIVSHRNELKFTDDLNQQVIDLMDIIFDGEHKITVSSLLTEGDARQLMKSVISVLSVNTTIDETTSEQRKALLYSKVFIPEILKLSIFNDPTRKDTFNPLLEDLYNYLSTNVVLDSNVSSSDINLAKAELNIKQAVDEAKQTGIDWISELSSLLNVSMDLIEIAETVIDDVSEPINLIFNIFPDDNEKVKNANLTHFNNLINGLSKSKLLDTVLSMTVIKDAIDNSLVALSSNIKLPSKINYANVYDANGNVTSYGEIYVLLTALKELVLTENTKTVVNSLVDGNFDASMIKTIAEIFLHETETNAEDTILDLSLKSTVLNYVISGVFLGFADAEDAKIKIIVPSNLCNVDSEEIVTIKKEELETLFTSLIGALDILKEDNQVDFKKVVENVDNLADSQIIEASVVYLLVDMLKDVDAVSIPEMYKNAATLEVLKGDFTENIWYTKNEISNIIYALDELLNISGIDDFDINNALNELTDHIGSLNDKSERETDKTKLQVVYKSDVLRSTFKNIVVTNVSDEFIDTRILNSSAIIETIDNIESIKISEIEALIYSFNELELDFQNMNLDSIADKVLGLNGQSIKDSSKSKVDVLFDSTLIRYILTKQMDNVLTEDLIQAVIRDSSYVKDDEVIDDITYHYYKKDEIKGLVNSLNELSITDFNNVDSENIKSNVLALDEQSTVDNTKTKLDILYSSSIIKFALVKQVDNALTEDLIPTAVRDSEEVKTIVSIDSNPYAYYKQSEIISIIKSTKELGITDLDGIDPATVKGKVLDLNDNATTSTTGTKLDVLYSSVIIKYAISKQMDDSIDADLTPTAVRDSENVKEFITISGTQYGYYKQAEVANLIDSTKELGITDLDGIDPAVVKGKVLDLNDNATTSTTGTKLDVLYTSTIIKYAIAKQMDGSIDADLTPTAVRDSENVKEFITISGTQYGYYKQTEVSNLISSTKELGITDLDGIDPAVVKGKVLDLNDNATTATTGTKLDVLYTSTIIKYAIAKQMDGSIDSDLTPTAVRNSENVKEFIEVSETPYGYYKKLEVKNLISSTKELGITDLDGIDPAVVKGKVLDLNDNATTSTTGTKLDVLYTSTIIKYAIAKQMDGSIGADLIPTAVRDSDNVKEFIVVSETPYGYYKKLEVKNLINSTKELGITNLDGIDPDTVKSKVLDLNDDATTDSGTLTKLDVLYLSTITTYAVAKQLDTAITVDLVSLNVRDSDLTKDYLTVGSDKHYYYKQAEVVGIINAVTELNINDIDDISVNQIKGEVANLNKDATTDSGTLTKLDVLYSSIVIKYAVSERFETIFTNATLDVDAKVLAKAKDNDEIATNYYYIKSDVTKLVDALGAKGLGITTLDDTNNVDENTVLGLNDKATGSDETKLHVIYKSPIMAYILTDKLSAAINSNAILVDDDEAKYEYLDTEVKFYLESELAILIKALKEDLSVTDVNTVDASSIVLDDTIKADILDSVLLFDAVSKIIIDNNTLVKPTISLRKNSYNVQKIVDDEQMTYLLNVLIKLGVSNMSAGITVNLSSDVNENISLSYILRATVSDKVLDNSEIKVATANIDSGITDYSVIKETEMLAMLNAISEGLGLNNVSGITSTISLPGKNDLDLDNKIAAISASQIIRATITKKLDFKDQSDNTISIRVLASDSDVLTQINTLTTNNLLAIKEAEMAKLIKAIVVGLGDDDSTATGGQITIAKLQTLSASDLDTFLASSTITLLTDKLLNKASIIALYTLAGGTVDAVNASVYNVANAIYASSLEEYLTATCQKDMISKVSA